MFVSKNILFIFIDPVTVARAILQLNQFAKFEQKIYLFQTLGHSVTVKFVEENLVEVVPLIWLEKKADENNVNSHFLIYFCQNKPTFS